MRRWSGGTGELRGARMVGVRASADGQESSFHIVPRRALRGRAGLSSSASCGPSGPRCRCVGEATASPGFSYPPGASGPRVARPGRARAGRYRGRRDNCRSAGECTSDGPLGSSLPMAAPEACGCLLSVCSYHDRNRTRATRNRHSSRTGRAESVLIPRGPKAADLRKLPVPPGSSRFLRGRAKFSG